MFNREVVSYMTVSHTFIGIRVLPFKLSTVTWNLNINLAGLEKDAAISKEDHQQKLSVAYQKIGIWLEYFLDDIILVDSEDADNSLVFNQMQYDNTLVQIPGVSDDVFLEALHSKISIIAGKELLIGEVSLHGSDTKSTFHFSNIQGNSYSLPAQDEWMDIDQVVFFEPWWKRNDCDTWEPGIEEGKTREQMIEDIDTSNVLDKIIADVTTSSSEFEIEEETEAEIIKPKWKPKTV